MGSCDDAIFVVKYRRLPLLFMFLLLLWVLYFMYLPVNSLNFQDGLHNLVVNYFMWGDGRLQGTLRFTLLLLVMFMALRYKTIVLVLYFGDIYLYDKFIIRKSILPFIIDTKIMYENATFETNHGPCYYNDVSTSMVICGDYRNTFSSINYSRHHILFLASCLCSNTNNELEKAYNYILTNIKIIKVKKGLFD